MSILGFKIWYSDHAEYGVTYDDWVKCQNDDVQVVVIYEDNLIHGAHHEVTRVLNNHFSFFGLTEDCTPSAGDSRSEVSGHIKTGAHYFDELILQEAVNDQGYNEFIEPYPLAPKEKG